MPKIKGSTDDGKLCRYCGKLVVNATDQHEEFDFFKHPNKKKDVLELRRRLAALPKDERVYALENYAAHQGLLRNYEVKLVNGQKFPMYGSIVMTGYARLENCYKWVKILIEQETGVDDAREQAGVGMVQPTL